MPYNNNGTYTRKVMRMVNVYVEAYEAMFGNINEDTISYSPACMSQCTGCTCSCRCSCRASGASGFEWEDFT